MNTTKQDMLVCLAIVVWVAMFGFTAIWQIIGG